MGRRRAYDREQVLARATEEFWYRGYKATSIEDLVAATGINRSSMYAEFGSKSGLFNAALQRYLAAGALADVLREDTVTPIQELMRAVFDELIDIAIHDRDRRGCMMTNTAVELSPHDDEVAEVLRAEFLKLEGALAERIERAQMHREIPMEKDPISLARSIVSTIQGMRVLSKVNPDRDVMEDIAAMALAQLDPPE